MELDTLATDMDPTSSRLLSLTRLFLYIVGTLFSHALILIRRQKAFIDRSTQSAISMITSREIA
jgi:hypothetical protein